MVKFTLEPTTKAQRGADYSTTLSLTPELDGAGGQHHAPVALPLRKTPYPLKRRLGGPQGRSRRVWKVSPHVDSIPAPSSP